MLNAIEKPVLVSLYAVIDSFHDIKEEQMVRLNIFFSVEKTGIAMYCL